MGFQQKFDYSVLILQPINLSTNQKAILIEWNCNLFN